MEITNRGSAHPKTFGHRQAILNSARQVSHEVAETLVQELLISSSAFPCDMGPTKLCCVKPSSLVIPEDSRTCGLTPKPVPQVPKCMHTCQARGKHQAAVVQIMGKLSQKLDAVALSAWITWGGGG